MSQEPVHDSPEGWVNDHIQSYLETDGETGHDWHGVPALLLTTRGRKSGLLRRTALYYTRDGANYVVAASRGGSDAHPAWYLNLAETPEVGVQAGAEKFAAVAHTAHGEERARLWALLVAAFPRYDEFQAATAREIPVVVLVPAR